MRPDEAQGSRPFIANQGTVPSDEARAESGCYNTKRVFIEASSSYVDMLARVIGHVLPSNLENFSPVSAPTRTLVIKAVELTYQPTHTLTIPRFRS